MNSRVNNFSQYFPLTISWAQIVKDLHRRHTRVPMRNILLKPQRNIRKCPMQIIPNIHRPPSNRKDIISHYYCGTQMHVCFTVVGLLSVHECKHSCTFYINMKNWIILLLCYGYMKIFVMQSKFRKEIFPPYEKDQILYGSEFGKLHFKFFFLKSEL